MRHQLTTAAAALASARTQHRLFPKGRKCSHKRITAWPCQEVL
jgi:hypothetical protein